MPSSRKCRHQENAVIKKMPSSRKCRHQENAAIKKMLSSRKCCHQKNAVILSGVWPVFWPNGVEGPAFGPLKDATKL
jgi:hypothetical protein